MANQLKCGTTNKRITNDTGVAKFPCPSCGYEFIVRSKHARKTAAKYTCPKCGFVGPN